jgi:SAM-dependent methyltransferase
MDARRPDPSAIIGLATSYWASMVLLAANRLHVFTVLGGQSLSAAQVAGKCGAQPRSMALLLNACVAQGLLARDADFYRNTSATDMFLVEGNPAYVGDALRYSEDLYPVWGRLADAVRSNAPLIPPETILGADPDKTRNFVLGMHNRARGVAASLAATIDLTGKKRLLDVGGGPGTYSIMLVRQTPGLSATVLDLPGVVAIAREIIAGSGAGDRIDVVAGDYSISRFPADRDAVLMSGILHRETPEGCRALLRKAFDALVPGGLLVLSDVFFDDERGTDPPFAALFALNMLLTSEHGSAHARTEMTVWMSEAGFVDLSVRPLPPPMPHVVLLATKP